ncbi:putative Rubrofusarin-specific efflux pump aurT [Seiridium cardinale]|uniref:Rubrofusarin-specific efflux pump aurT n=1 Tax=Seiridium cardinale TaxID=138064 RepID=A0ABR2XW39_9PEZI
MTRPLTKKWPTTRSGITIAVLVWLMPAESNLNEEEIEARHLSLKEKIAKLDPIGTSIFIPAVVCLLLALQWGGATYAWNDARIIVLCILFGLLSIGFVVVQIWKGEDATAIQGVDAVQSGIRLLPIVIALVMASFIVGGMVRKMGYCTPFLIICSILANVGAGLMSTFRANTPQSIWIGYQVLFGFGIGLGQQQAGLAAQTVLPTKDVPAGVSIKFFGQQLGGAVFVSAAQNIFSNRLVSGLSSLGLDIDPKAIVNLGATELKNYVGPENLQDVLVIYNNAIDQVFMLAAILAGLSLLGALLTEWKSIKGQSGKGDS